MAALIPNVVRRHPNIDVAMSIQVTIENGKPITIAEAVLEAGGSAGIRLAEVFEEVAQELRTTQGGQ